MAPWATTMHENAIFVLNWKMMRHGNVISMITLLTFLFTTGCANVISPEMMKEVDTGIRFDKLQEDPEAYTGRRVLLGGDIIETKNYPDRTLIFVLQRSLDYRKRPVSGASKGRFIVSQPEFLDPAVYQPKRKITVVGKVIGKEAGKWGEMDCTCPLIESNELYLWPVIYPSTGEPEIQIDGQIGIGIIIFRRK
jgi:outer membrane lipoprotein